MTAFKFELLTPYRKFFSGDVEAVTLTLADGETTIYAHHSFFTAPTIACLVRIKEAGGEWKTAFAASGLLEVKGHNTILMADAAEWPEEIDKDRAVEAKDKAEKDLDAAVMKFETERAEKALRRAKLRLKLCETAEGNTPAAV